MAHLNQNNKNNKNRRAKTHVKIFILDFLAKIETQKDSF